MFNAMQQRLNESASEMMVTASDQLVEVVPQVILALIILAVGALVAHIAKRIVLHIFDFLGLDKLAAKVNVDKALHAVGIKRSVSRIVGLLVYWLIVLFALLLMSEALELGTIVSEAIGAIVAYIPRLIAGLLILVIGLIVGRFFRDVVSTSLARAGIAASTILGHIVQAIIVIFVCLIALKQVGFDVSVITTNIAVILGVLLISGGLALALAARPVLEEFFISRQLSRHLKRGDVITYEDVEGEVVEFSPTNVVIRSNGEDVVLPVRKLFEGQFSKKTNK